MERDDILDIIDTTFERTISDEGHTLFVAGDAGIGETSLLNAFLTRVEGKCKMYVVACVYRNSPGQLTLLNELAAQLSDDLSCELQPRLTATELFSNFVASLSGTKSPLVIVFENVHWADESTLDLIKFLARRIHRIKCLFILTYRAGEISQEHPLRSVLGELSPDTFSRIQLTPLPGGVVRKKP